MSNETNHKNDICSYKKWAKCVFHKCNHGYKNVAWLYVSNGARPMVTIIGYSNGSLIIGVCVCVCVCVCMLACMCV